MSDDPKAIVHWNDPKILTATGVSPDAIRALLGKYEQGVPTDFAVYQWVSRRKIPDKWRARLIYCLLRDERINMVALFRRGSSRRVPPAEADAAEQEQEA